MRKQHTYLYLMYVYMNAYTHSYH
uniref:Uncharacterized protein n=1 Tax=Arundo donax TaxID=35708 RepID=A0A0A8Y5P0_ARUDO